MNIHLPSIVVIGDQNSGKCRLLESLAGQDAKYEMNAKVPMGLRLENESFLQFTTYADAAGGSGKRTLSEAMTTLIGKHKNIGLEVKNKGVPELLFIDLPELIGVPSDDTKAKAKGPKDTIFKLGRSPMLSGANTTTNIVFMLNYAMEKFHGQLIKQRLHEYNTHLIDMLNDYYEEVQMDLKFSDNFLDDELSEIKFIGSLPKSLLASILVKKLEGISQVMISFVKSVCVHVDNLTISALTDVFGDNIELMSVVNQIASYVLKKMKVRFIEWVNGSLEMDKMSAFYTCDTDFSVTRNNLTSGQKDFLKVMHGHRVSFVIEGQGVIDVSHLHGIPDPSLVEAYELRVQLTAYLKVIVKRLVDSTVVQLRFLIEAVMNREMQSEMVNVLLAFGHDLRNLLKQPSQ